MKLFILSEDATFDTVIISHHFNGYMFTFCTSKNVFFNFVNTKTLWVSFILSHILLVLTFSLLHLVILKKVLYFLELLP